MSGGEARARPHVPAQGWERIDKSRLLPASPRTLWRAWTEPRQLDRWMTAEAEVDLRDGGAYRFDYGGGIVSTGTFLRVEPPRRLVMVDDVGHGTASVTVTLEPADAGTRLSLVDVSSGRGDEWQWFREGTDRWWDDFLRNLTSVLVDGRDLRPHRLWPRVFAGFRYLTLPEHWQAHTRARRGALVLDVVSGSPAERADLQRGDVVTELAGSPVSGHHDVADALLRREPGERVSVAFVRRGEARRTRVRLEPSAA